MLLIKYFLPLVTVGVGGTLVAGTCNRLQTETRIDRSDFENTSTVNNIHKETSSDVKWFLGRKQWRRSKR